MDHEIVGVLQDARELCRSDWGSCNLDADVLGSSCAYVGMSSAALCDPTTTLAACTAFLKGAGLRVPTGEDEIYAAVWAFNDAQTDRGPVLAAFDRAIGTLKGEPTEPTPNADATISVMTACDQAGAVVADSIVAAHPEMDRGELRTLAAAELFYAAQDTARVCDLSARS